MSEIRRRCDLLSIVILCTVCLVLGGMGNERSDNTGSEPSYEPADLATSVATAVPLPDPPSAADFEDVGPEKGSPGDTVLLPIKAGAGQEMQNFLALPNPVRNQNDKVMLRCRTRCDGTALVNIYDAVGSVVFQTVVQLQQPGAMEYKMCIPWNCRNRQGRVVGKGTYLAVVRIFDTEQRLVARSTVNIGVAY